MNYVERQLAVEALNHDLRDLQAFKEKVKRIQFDTEDLSKQYKTDGYLEDLLIDIQYHIEELEEEIALVETGFVTS